MATSKTGRLGQAVPATFYQGPSQVTKPVGTAGPTHVSVPTVPGQPEVRSFAVDPAGTPIFPEPAARPLPTKQQLKSGGGQLLQAGGEAMQAGMQTPIGKMIGRIMTPISATNSIINSIAAEQGKSLQHFRQTGQRSFFQDQLDVIHGLMNSHPWTALKQGAQAGELTDFKPFAEWAAQDPASRKAMEKVGGPHILDFIASFPAYELMGIAQGGAVAEVGKGLAAANQATGAGRAILGGLTAAQESLQAKGLLKGVPTAADFLANRQAYQGGQEVLNRAAAQTEKYPQAVGAAAADLRQTSQRLLKQGVAVRSVNPVTNKPLNVLDELVNDYMDAGAKGSKYEHLGAGRAAELGHVQADAAVKGIPWTDVQRIGDKYSTSLDAIGQHMVYTGLLDSATYQALKGSYLTRLYHLRAVPTNEAEDFLKFLHGTGAMTAADVRAARAEVAPLGFTRPGLGVKPGAARQIEDFAKRTNLPSGLARVPEATPAVTRYAGSAASAIGKAAGQMELAANPEFAQPLATAPAHWVNFAGEGPLKGLAVHPGIARLLEVRAAPAEGIIEGFLNRRAPTAGRAWTSLNRGMRKLWLSAPYTQLNIISGHYQLASAAAELNHTRFTMPQYATALSELRAAAKGGKPARYLQEALAQTDILSSKGNLIPKGARRIGAGFGVETTAQKALAAPGQAYDWYRGQTHGALAGGKYGLYKALRGSGKGVDEAARITRNATINYSDVGPLTAALERDNLAPFITFPLRAVSQYLQQAVRRPDLFYTGSGERARRFLDVLADDYAKKHGQRPEAQAGRRRGDAGLADFPIPGRRTPQGYQAYASAPILAPIMHHFAHSGAEDPVGFLQSQVQHLFPLGQAAGQAITGLTAQGKPIIPSGSIPGTTGQFPVDVLTNKDAALLALHHFGKQFSPAISIGERLANAARGTTPVSSPRLGVQTLKEALGQTLLGVRVGPNIARSEQQANVLALQRMIPQLQAIKGTAFAHMNELMAGKAQPPPEFVAKAKEFGKEADVKAAISHAQKQLDNVNAGQQYDLAEKQRLTVRWMDWIAALLIRQKELLQSGFETLPEDFKKQFGGAINSLPALPGE